MVGSKIMYRRLVWWQQDYVSWASMVVGLQLGIREKAGQGVRDSKVSFDFFFFWGILWLTFHFQVGYQFLYHGQEADRDGEDLVIVLYLN